MKNVKLPFVILLLGCFMLPPWWSRAQQERGQGVRPPRVAAAGRYYALLIGVQTYRHPGVNPLDYPVGDARRVQRMLTENYSFAPGDVTLLTDPDRAAILAALDQLAERLRVEDHLLIFYAGHGHWDEQRKQGYWLPVDAQRGSRSNWISNSDLRDAIHAVRAQHTLLISDACFSGSLFVARDAFERSAAIEELSRLPSRSAMTSGALTTVPDRSVFVEYLLKRLGENQEAYLPAAELFSQFRVAVINNSPRQADGSRPTPRYGVIQEAGDEGGDFIFARRSSGPTFTPAPRPTLTPTPRPTPTPTPTPVPTPTPRVVAGVPLTTLASFTTVRTDQTGKVSERKQQQECWGYVEDLGNGVRLELAEIPQGEFQMGSNENDSEKPVHRVRVNGFLMSRYEVTQAQWRAVAKLPKVQIDLNPEPSRFKGDNLPVENVSWEEAAEFCARLSRKTGGRYGLPSEAQWEYAARAGTTTPFAFGPTITPELVNYDGNFPYGQAAKGQYRQQTTSVGSFPANAWGLFDMHGNVWEWCEDDWHDNYNDAPTDGRAWVDAPRRGSPRVIRGGSWFNYAVHCRSARRYGAPADRYDDLGFRLVRT